jgi:hypothetical protein
MGEQNKPLWLTEYGQLAPPISPPGLNYFTVPEPVTTDFMVKTLDWMLSTKNGNIGYEPDDYHLVQKFFWYSLNGSMTHFGGTLVDPVTLQKTFVGLSWLHYIPPAGSIKAVNPDLYPLSVSPVVISSNPAAHQANYRLTVRVRNAVIADHFVDIRVNVKDGENTLATQNSKTARCGGDALLTFDLVNLPTTPPRSICVNVEAPTMTDVNLGNNTLCVKMPTSMFYVPFTRR